MTTERLPPHDIEAEEAVIGSLVIDSDAMVRIAPFLLVEDFYREKNGWCLEACLTLYQQRMPIDQVTLSHELARAGRLEAVGGAAYLSHLIANVPTSVHIEHYGRIVHNLGVARRLICLASQIGAIGYEAGDMEEGIAQSLGSLLELSKEGMAKDYLYTPWAMAEYAMERYTALKEIGAGVPFGLPCVDKLGGLQTGELVVIAGETSVGKTTLASQVAQAISLLGPVLFCSTEMSKPQTLDRNVARLIGEYVRVVAKGGYGDELADRILGEGLGRLAEERVYYYIKAGMRPTEIYAVGRRMQAEHGLKAIIVDYIQNLRDDQGGKSAYQAMTNIVRALKGVAMELDVPLIAACQLSRAPEGGKPSLHRLRDSGAIEETADWVIFLYRKEKDTDRAMLIVAKHRQGGEHLKQALRFIWREQRYEEIEAEGEGD